MDFILLTGSTGQGDSLFTAGYAVPSWLIVQLFGVIQSLGSYHTVKILLSLRKRSLQ